MKFAKPLTQPEITTLEQLYQYGPNHRLRQRAHIILMSHKQFTMDDIARAISLDRDTISKMITLWDSDGLSGLYDRAKSGRRPIFSEEEQDRIIKKIELDPRNLKKTTFEINEETHKSASIDTVKRVLKKRKRSGKE